MFFPQGKCRLQNVGEFYLPLYRFLFDLKNKQTDMIDGDFYATFLVIYALLRISRFLHIRKVAWKNLWHNDTFNKGIINDFGLRFVRYNLSICDESGT